MFVSPCENEWHWSYELASQVLKDDPAKRAKLDNIYADPKYYSAYHVRSIDSNLRARGLVPAKKIILLADWGEDILLIVNILNHLVSSISNLLC